jgi:hypothetical protein
MTKKNVFTRRFLGETNMHPKFLMKLQTVLYINTVGTLELAMACILD